MASCFTCQMYYLLFCDKTLFCRWLGYFIIIYHKTLVTWSFGLVKRHRMNLCFLSKRITYAFNLLMFNIWEFGVLYIMQMCFHLNFVCCFFPVFNATFDLDASFNYTDVYKCMLWIFGELSTRLQKDCDW